MVGRRRVLPELRGVDAYGYQRRIILGLGNAHHRAAAKPALALKIVVGRQGHFDIQCVARTWNVFGPVRGSQRIRIPLRLMFSTSFMVPDERLLPGDTRHSSARL